MQKHTLHLVLLTIATLVVQSCTQKTNQASLPDQNDNSAESIASTPPFQTKEPIRYWAKRVTTIVTASGQSITEEIIAKDGEMRRTEWSTPIFGTMVYLELSNGRFLVSPEEKIYADVNNEKEVSDITDEFAQLENSPDRILHADSTTTKYQRIGNEVLKGRNCNKYRVVVNNVGLNTVTSTETTVWFDESLGMPIKSDTSSSNGSRSIIELSDISLDADAKLWLIPKDYIKVEPDVIRRRLNRPVAK